MYKIHNNIILSAMFRFNWHQSIYKQLLQNGDIIKTYNNTIFLL